VITVFVHEGAATRRADHVNPAWLELSSAATVWTDLAAPTEDELNVLRDVFRFHDLAVEDARSALQYPKVEAYEGYLYLVLHGIDLKAGQAASGAPRAERGGAERRFATRDIDFFVGRNFLVTIHDGMSRSIAKLREVCDRHEHVLAEGPVALLHRIVDAMVDNYRPVVEELEERIERLEEHAFGGQQQIARQVTKLRRELATMRRILVPQRDAIGRLARREFALVSNEMAYRFRDVYDHVVRLTEEALLFHDRVTGILEMNLATVSNRTNAVMKVLTVMGTIFLPLTVVTGMWGMNIALPRFPGGDGAQFWWVAGVMFVTVAAMLSAFRWKRWI
jgi:magnesium transporter